jgi:hypothetical protein
MEARHERVQGAPGGRSGRAARALLLVALGAGAACGGPEPAAPPPQPSQAERAWPAVAPRLLPGMSDEAKAVAIAAWVAAHSSNEPAGPDAPVPPIRGLCGQRAGAFVELARRAGLRAARLDFARFGSSAHSAAQAWYDGGWHYFDVTYAGYFRVGGRILAFEEIQADPAAALAGMVVLPGGGLDRWSDGTVVDNAQRMRQAYTPEAIATAEPRAARRDEPFGAPRSPASVERPRSGRVGQHHDRRVPQTALG